MKKYPHEKATALRCRAAAATLLVGGAFGGLALPAFAGQPGQSADGVPPAKVQVFETSQALRQATLTAVAASSNSDPTKASGASPTSGAVAPAAAEPAVAISWILDSTNRPWPLTTPELLPLNVLSLSLPAEREARTMLPGAIADMTDRARFTVTRYVTDNIGAALQARGRQLETFSQWLAALDTQKKALPKDPWAAYEFSNEAREKVTTFKTKVSAQTAPTVQRMADDINTAVAQITPVMNVMGSYEQKLQWYNILVQLKDGMAAYQARALEADRQVLDAIDAFERENPPVARPAGRVPAEPGSAAATMTVATPAPVAVQPVKRESAQAPAAPADQSGVSGNVVLLAVGALVLGFFFMLRKRVANKGRSAKTATE